MPEKNGVEVFNISFVWFNLKKKQLNPDILAQQTISHYASNLEANLLVPVMSRKR